MDDACHPVIRLSDVTYNAEGRSILADVNLTVDRRDFIAVTGPNGGGKTTLLKIILRLLKPTTITERDLNSGFHTQGLKPLHLVNPRV